MHWNGVEDGLGCTHSIERFHNVGNCGFKKSIELRMRCFSIMAPTLHLIDRIVALLLSSSSEDIMRIRLSLAIHFMSGI